MASSILPPGTIYAARESLQTPARLALGFGDSDASLNSCRSSFSTYTNTDYGQKKVRPCVVMPYYGKGPMTICAMGTFEKSSRTTLASVYQHFITPVYSNVATPEDEWSLYITGDWASNAWIIAYPYPPRGRFLHSWRQNDIEVEVDDDQLCTLFFLSQDRVEEWETQMNNNAFSQAAISDFKQSMLLHNMKRCLNKLKDQEDWQSMADIETILEDSELDVTVHPTVQARSFDVNFPPLNLVRTTSALAPSLKASSTPRPDSKKTEKKRVSLEPNDMCKRATPSRPVIVSLSNADHSDSDSASSEDLSTSEKCNVIPRSQIEPSLKIYEGVQNTSMLSLATTKSTQSRKVLRSAKKKMRKALGSLKSSSVSQF